MSVRKILMLELYMKKYGFTQAEMAEIIDTCTSNFTNKLKGKTKFYGDEMMLIRDAINERVIANGNGALTSDDIFLPI